MSHPEIFYKYMPVSTALKVLETGRLRWSSPLIFNDPSEWERMPRFDPTLNAANSMFTRTIVDHVYGTHLIDENKLSDPSKFIVELVKGLRQKKFAQEQVLQHLLDVSPIPYPDGKCAALLKKFFEGITGQARVLCVTTDYENDAMWALYAGESTGCVLGFKHLPEKDTPLLAANRVIYSENLPIVGSGLDLLLYGDTPELKSNTIKAVIYTKKTCWSYEKEWRAVTWRFNEAEKRYGDYPFLQDELASVILGRNCSTEDEKQIKNQLSLQYPQAQLSKLSL